MFQAEAEKAGIKPIAGADVLLADDDAAPARLTLLCQDREGYLVCRGCCRARGWKAIATTAWSRAGWLRDDNAG